MSHSLSRSLGLTLAVLCAPASIAQQMSAPALPIAGGFSASSTAPFLADCATDQVFTQDAVEGALPVGPTADEGDPISVGQSFTAPCTGTLQSVGVVVQNADGETPAQTVTVVLNVFDGSGTTGTLRATRNFDLALPAEGSAQPYTLPLADGIQVAEDGVYTFFLDQTAGPNFGIQADSSRAYTGGAAFFSAEGSSGAAEADDRFDLTFQLILGPPMTTADEGGVAADATLSAIRPNPVRDSGRMSLAVETPQTVSVTAFDALGRQVASLYQGTATPGSAVPLALDAASLAPGVYVVRAVGETFSTSQTVTVAR